MIVLRIPQGSQTKTFDTLKQEENIVTCSLEWKGICNKKEKRIGKQIERIITCK